GAVQDRAGAGQVATPRAGRRQIPDGDPPGDRTPGGGRRRRARWGEQRRATPADDPAHGQAHGGRAFGGPSGQLGDREDGGAHAVGRDDDGRERAFDRA